MFDGLPDPATCGGHHPRGDGRCDRSHSIGPRPTWSPANGRSSPDCWLHHKDQAADEEKTWAHDEWSAVRDQVGPALRLSPRRASGQMRLAEGLTTRLPKVAALLESGPSTSGRRNHRLPHRTARAAPSRPPSMPRSPSRPATTPCCPRRRSTWPWTAIIEEHDPDACRRYRDAAKGCDVGFGNATMSPAPRRCTAGSRPPTPNSAPASSMHLPARSVRTIPGARGTAGRGPRGGVPGSRPIAVSLR